MGGSLQGRHGEEADGPGARDAGAARHLCLHLREGWEACAETAEQPGQPGGPAQQEISEARLRDQPWRRCPPDTHPQRVLKEATRQSILSRISGLKI
jgi:hypothetical protein